MRDDERVEELENRAPVFAVAPVREHARLPRTALLGIAVGVVAFVAGIGAASAGPSRTPTPSFAVATERPAQSDAAVAATAEPVAPGDAGADSLDPGFGAPAAGLRDTGTGRLPAPGTSRFIAGFDPAALIASLDGAERCEAGEPRDKEVPRTRRDGPRMTFQRSWIAWCPVPEAARRAFVLDVFRTMTEAVPAEAYGYSASLSGAGSALFPYGEQPLAGTVAVAADDAGRGVAIAIVVSEWRVDSAP